MALLSDVIDRYRADRIAKGYEHGTVRNEQTTLRHLLTDVGNIHVHNIGPAQMDRFWAAHSNWAPSSANKALAHLSGFFKWCQTRGLMPQDKLPLNGVRYRRVPKRERLVIPQGEWDNVFEATDHPRNRAIVALGLYLFARPSELQSLHWRDIHMDEKRVAVYRHKTKDFDFLPMCQELEHELRRWRLAYADEAGELPKPDWYVIPRRQAPKLKGSLSSGERISHGGGMIPTQPLSTLSTVVKRILERAGYSDLSGEGAYVLRRSGATALYTQLSSVGHDRAIRMCQAMLGHAHITTTEVYLQLDVDRKTRNDLLAGQRMFPEEDVVAEVVNLERKHGQEDAGSV